MPNNPALSPRGITRRRALATIAGLAVVGVGTRIWQVNTSAAGDYMTPTVEHHAMGEWVSLGGSFVESRQGEDTDGYSLRISTAQLLSYNEFVERYAVKESIPPLEGFDVKSLVCLTMDVQNDHSNGGLWIREYYLVPQRKNEFLVTDRYLLTASEKALPLGMKLSSISIRPGTEHTTTLAFRKQSASYDIDGVHAEDAWMEEVFDTSFELLISNIPIQHVIDVKLQ